MHISNGKRRIKLHRRAIWLSLGLSYILKTSRCELSTMFLLRTLEFNSIVCVHKNCLCIFFIVPFCLSLKWHGAKLSPTSEFPNMIGQQNLWLLTLHLHILDYCKLSYYSWHAQLKMSVYLNVDIYRVNFNPVMLCVEAIAFLQMVSASPKAHAHTTTASFNDIYCGHI